MLDTRQIHSMTDFLRNYKEHVARLKETRTPEVLTVNGRAEVVVLDTESYETLVESAERLRAMEAIAAVRAEISRSDGLADLPTPEELDRRRAVMRELVAETERIGLYR
jgi:PHD/YefM family antitoxin component YafN of YafNO toxin-antitoxin module